MNWGVKENRVAVIALHKCDKSVTEIYNLLKKLKINKTFIYRTIERYNETFSVSDRKKSGRPRTVRTPKIIKAVKERIRRNPLRKQKILARGLKISKKHCHAY